MTYYSRRLFLRNTLATAVLVGAGALGLRPGPVYAAAWPKEAFNTKPLEQAIAAVFGPGPLIPSTAIRLRVPTQAENSAQVQVQVIADLPNVEAIAVFVEKNPFPLVAQASFHGADGFFATRMKMGQTSDVVVVVKSGGKLYTARQNVKVTVGGCGG